MKGFFGHVKVDSHVGGFVEERDKIIIEEKVSFGGPFRSTCRWTCMILVEAPANSSGGGLHPL